MTTDVSEHFTLAEMIRSETAERFKTNNKPSQAKPSQAKPSQAKRLSTT